MEELEPVWELVRTKEDEAGREDLIVGDWPAYPLEPPHHAWRATVREPDTGLDEWVEFVRFGNLVYSADSSTIQYFTPLAWEWS